MIHDDSTMFKQNPKHFFPCSHDQGWLRTDTSNPDFGKDPPFLKHNFILPYLVLAILDLWLDHFSKYLSDILPRWLLSQKFTTK